ncbi:hypothetical protein NQ315_015966 [Exocentrus adspersus]|uniref:DUF7041 domain-containing protein n=1 Tax=Exocentrus adspersus TaxID=1586481 RepID=A0AAV8VIY3_9CUCU|nr:hypothetical protein NQ315_015966 [Exocentrus adspersus]
MPDNAQLEIPPFWQKNPARWFSQVEAQFALSKITQDETKYYHIVANLEPHIAEEVGDIIDSPPAQGKYEKIKKELIAQQIRRILEGEELGDRRPSQFLRHLRGLAGDSVSDTILRSLWMSRLPSHTQAILAMDDDVALDSRAKGRQNLEMMRQHQLQEVASTSRREKDLIYQAIDALEKKIAKLCSAQENFDRPRPRSRSRSRTRNRDLCWYHDRFAAKAKKCTPPCNFVSENENARR